MNKCVYSRIFVIIFFVTDRTDHAGSARRHSDLAGLYDAQGKYDEAEPLYQRSLAIYEKALGPDHPYEAVSLWRFAIFEMIFEGIF